MNNVQMNKSQCYRFYSSDTLESYAEGFRNRQRRLDTSTLVCTDGMEKYPYTFICLWDNFITKDHRDLCFDLYGKMPWRFYGHNKDQTAMGISFSRLAEDKLPNFPHIDLRNQLTGGSSLLDFLVSDVNQNYGGWVYPGPPLLKELQSKRAVSLSSLDEPYKWYEITIGTSSDEQISETIDFFSKNHKADCLDCPTFVISFDVESIHIPRSDYESLPGPGVTGLNRIVHTREVGRGEKASMIPARIIVGGTSWILSVRFNITSVKSSGKVEHILYNDPIQPKLKKFLEELPTGTGNAVKHDYDDVTEYIRKFLCAPDFCFKNGWVDLSVLGAVAGFHSRRSTMFNMNFQILGGILSKNHSEADHLWGLTWSELPKEFQIYLLGDVRAGHNMYIVLYGALLRNLFPDPDIICMLTNKSQPEIAAWFGKFLVGLLKKLEIDRLSYEAAVSRQDLISSLRVRESHDDSDDESESGFIITRPGKLRPYPPQRIVEFSNVIPPWPTIVFGGARFLHSVRAFATKQLEVLRNLDVPKASNPWKEVIVSPYQEMMITYCQQLQTLTPSEGSSSVHLAPDPHLPHPVATFDPASLLNSDISAIAREQKRPSRTILAEWARLNSPSKTVTLLKRASEEYPNRETRFWFPTLSRYEELRSSYEFVTANMGIMKCEWAEKKITSAQSKLAVETEERLRVLKEQVRVAKKRKAALELASEMGPHHKRVALQESIPPLPLLTPKTVAQIARRRRKNQKRKAKRKNIKDSSHTRQVYMMHSGSRESVQDTHEPEFLTYDSQDSDSRESIQDTREVRSVSCVYMNEDRTLVYRRIAEDFSKKF